MTFTMEAWDGIAALRGAYRKQWPGRIPDDTDAFYLAALERGLEALDKELQAHVAPTIVLPGGYAVKKKPNG